MAAIRKLAEKTTLFGAISSTPQEMLPSPMNHIARRGYHIDLGAREKALLEEDPALKRFKSYKNNLKRISKVGDALTIVVVAACAYQLYAVTTVRKE
ncbi:succinate dehydrogenase subunit 7, mitochondrial-like isoform X2 [Zingiber officinale]|uniref:succinate dehydrogenase subunit 7, mitochondrial-like isoform X2 n=1 Tax=Zingiber officinale TaxID=94328 RepID=UPI001C4D8953|nr:succinate dehydrogenase subunit 7, mitochondrial-like isoform X2 [Zingiber officinale]